MKNDVLRTDPELKILFWKYSSILVSVVGWKNRYIIRYYSPFNPSIVGRVVWEK